jgi:hypothetical protein
MPSGVIHNRNYPAPLWCCCGCFLIGVESLETLLGGGALPPWTPSSPGVGPTSAWSQLLPSPAPRVVRGLLLGAVEGENAGQGSGNLVQPPPHVVCWGSGTSQVSLLEPLCHPRLSS